MELFRLPQLTTNVSVQMIDFIRPNWNIEYFYNLNYSWSTHQDAEIVDQYVTSGHSREKLSLYNYHSPNPMPKCVDEYIVPHFTFLNKVAVAVNYFKPGHYLPLHTDLYRRYVAVEKVDPTKIVRYMVMLENSSPGQILQIQDRCIGFWYSGDCFYWNYDDPHAFYNFSMKDRYAIQVTGVIK